MKRIFGCCKRKPPKPLNDRLRRLSVELPVEALDIIRALREFLKGTKRWYRLEVDGSYRVGDAVSGSDVDLLVVRQICSSNHHHYTADDGAEILENQDSCKLVEELYQDVRSFYDENRRFLEVLRLEPDSPVVILDAYWKSVHLPLLEIACVIQLVDLPIKCQEEMDNGETPLRDVWVPAGTGTPHFHLNLPTVADQVFSRLKSLISVAACLKQVLKWQFPRLHIPGSVAKYFVYCFANRELHLCLPLKHCVYRCIVRLVAGIDCSLASGTNPEVHLIGHRRNVLSHLSRFEFSFMSQRLRALAYALYESWDNDELVWQLLQTPQPPSSTFPLKVQLTQDGNDECWQDDTAGFSPMRLNIDLISEYDFLM